MTQPLLMMHKLELESQCNNSKMELSTKANGICKAEKTGKEFRSGLMALFTKATGRTTKLTAEDV